MLGKEPPDNDADKYFSIRKKHLFFWIVILILCAVIGTRFLFSHGFYLGFVPPPEPAPPLSQEMISRFNQLEDKINKAINDINEVYNLKEKLDKQSPPIDKSKKNNGNSGGKYLPLDKFNLASAGYEPQSSFEKLDTALEQINAELPLLKKGLTQAMLLQSNLPEGIPLIGKYTVSNSFGERIDPFTSQPAFHTGIDLSTDQGTPVVAAANGRVTKVVPNNDKSGYGNYIEITHPNQVTTLYGHLSAILVKENQELQKGELIGLVGDTGRSTGPHLHFEVQVAGKPVNPIGGGISPIVMKPNPIALSALDAELRAKCAPLLLIIKDETSKIFKDCLEAKGKGVKETLIAKQSESVSSSKKTDPNKLNDECVYIDENKKLQTDKSLACRNNSNSESSQ
jgi:murein DD-endopeptidase MepM/ murein hydrolase activator NlpD